MHFKKYFHSSTNGIALALLITLFLVSKGLAQEAFKIKWSMDYTQSGVSNHANFVPSGAVLAGGGNTNALNGGYGFGGAIVAAYVVRPWPTAFSDGRYMEFKFSAKSFKYNINSISMRLRRSPDGPKHLKIRTSLDGFTSDFHATTLVNASQFYSFSVPAGFNDLSENTFAFRIYGYGPTSIYGTLWFDEIIVNGEVLAIILPIDLTFFKARIIQNEALLSWETAWEKNSRQFLIERSTDPGSFTEIGSLPASGETFGRTYYEFTDKNPGEGVNQYRLRMVDQDDRFVFSALANAETDIISEAFNIVPNPAPATRISVSGKDIDAEMLTLTTLTGLRIICRHEKSANGLTDLLPEKPLLPGLYLLSYQKNGHKEHAKVLVR